MGKRFTKATGALSVALMGSMLLLTAACGTQTAKTLEEVNIEKDVAGNPLVGGSDSAEFNYGGDPSVLVDGDTVYLYTGNDISTEEEISNAIYNIPNYVCYSSTDLKNWTCEGEVMNMADVSWADETAAWASQVTKHYDPEQGKDLYYLYFCSWDRGSTGKQSIGVAVSESPTGPFTDIGSSLVRGAVTKPQMSNWDDIDPTVWIETDENGEEHRYLAWGNAQFYICELNEDMISVKDINGDGEITATILGGDGDIVNMQSGLESYTEAPWLYRRSDENGNYYGDYYLFYAYTWRECMAYATTDSLMDSTWNFGSMIMAPTSTSNTNHMAVFDFKGETYFVYHNGSLPGGNGYRRSACITKLKFNDDGSVEPMEETAVGISGTSSMIKTASDEYISHENYLNSTSDSDYPYSDVKVGVDMGKTDADKTWLLINGKATAYMEGVDVSENPYVSIQSENKPGLYLTVSGESIVLAQDTDASEETANSQTFKTVTGLSSSDMISFESVSNPGMYITVTDDGLALTDGSDREAASFVIE